MSTIGTHNLHDQTGVPTPFADVLLFTEAIPARIREVLADEYDIYPCPLQRDLVLAFRKGVWEDHGWGYRLAHPGVPLVTPHRGTYRRRGLLHGERTKVMVEHRINAAFAPFIRGEARFRPSMWKRHTNMTLRMIRRAKRGRWLVIAGGDLNTPRGVAGYRGQLHEVGGHFDRLGSTRAIREVAVLSKKGSDHPRLRGRLG